MMKRAAIFAGLLCAGLLPAGAALPAAPGLTVTDLRCEYRENPLGIDATQPRLSWILNGPERNLQQSAYQIIVASTKEKLKTSEGDWWDSGQVTSDHSIQVAYAGRALPSHAECFWKVRVWDQDGNVSDWSRPALWTMGVLRPEDWTAKWIGRDGSAAESRRQPARWLRKEFVANKRINRATLSASGLGLSEFYVNGEKIGDHVLSPALAQYDKRVFYVTHDVTKQLQRGTNAIGAVLGNGRYYADRSNDKPGTVSFGWPKLRLQLRLEFTDGSVSNVISDTSWKLTTDGPIRANSEYDGEEYDARKEFTGWSEPGFDDRQWQPAQLAAVPPGVVAAQMIEPIRVTQTRKPIALTEPKPGVFVFDLGQNMAGWCRLKVSGPAGTLVTLRHAETLKPDGTLSVTNLRSARATDTYTLRGDGSESYEPRFTYHGFRYVEVTGFPGKPTLDVIVGRVVNDDLETTGTFTCSNELLNRIYTNIVWGTRGNYRSIPTDSPQRDERQGWLGDRAEASKGESFLFNIAPLYAKWLQDIADAQKPGGSLPDVAPAYWPIYSDDVTWPSSFVIIPSMLERQYADAQVIARHYDGAKRWIEYMERFVTNGLIAKDSYGDLGVPAEGPAHKTDPTLLATAYFYRDLWLLERYAQALGKTNDAAVLHAQAETIKAAFNEKFLNRQLGQYDNGTQTAGVLPLAFGLVPDDQRDRVFNQLVQTITVNAKGHIGTGLIGGQYLNRVLSLGGRPDLGYTIATQKDFPGWGYMLANGATTIWERWNGNTAGSSINSGNHLSLVGDLVIWLYENLAGIKCNPEQPGFKGIIMRPTPVGDLTFVKATYRSAHGLIASEWHKAGDTFDWKITIPANTTAAVFVPAKQIGSVTEGGRPANLTAGAEFLGMEGGFAIFRVGSGSYHFVSQ